MTPDELRARLDALPRTRLASLPTPLHSTPRLAESLGLPRLWFKRDDLTGLALGGNKSRGLEFVVGEALAIGCEVFVAGGGVEQSNHAVQCAAAAKRAGIEPVVVLRRRSDAYRGGNDLLRDLLSVRTVWVDADSEMSDRSALDDTMLRVGAEIEQGGRQPFLLRSSVHPLMVLGYVSAVVELWEQLDDPHRPLSIYVTSEGAALGGLVLGYRLLGLPWTVTGVAWRPLCDPWSTLLEVAEEATRLLDVDNPVVRSDLEIRATGEAAYGVCTSASRQAMRLAAEREGIVLDPVYSARGFSGLMSDVGHRDTDETVFVHTGGVGATFAYGEQAYKELEEAR